MRKRRASRRKVSSRKKTVHRFRGTRTGRFVKRARAQKGGKVNWKKAGDWIKNKAVPFIKQNKLVSRGLGAIGNVLPAQYGAVVKGAAAAAGQYGYGRCC